jgi:hypothetical protein
MKCPPEDAYRVGLVAQTLTDAAPEGLTIDALGDRTRLERPPLARALRICLEHRHARHDGRRYFAA